MAPDPEVTLKEFINFRFDKVENRIDDLEERVESRMDRLEGKVEGIEKCISNDIKHTIKVMRYISGLIVSVLLILAAAWLRQRLGL